MSRFAYIKFTLTLLFTGVVLSGCIPQNNNCSPFKPIGEIPGYTFEIPVSIYPQNKILKLGDTLFIEVVMADSIDDHLFKKHSLEKHKLASYPFYITPLFDRVSDNFLQKTTFMQSAQKEIDVVMITGQSQHHDTVNDPHKRRGLLNYYFKYTSQQYELKLAVIPKKQGTYLLNFINMEIPKESFPWVCWYRNIKAKLNVNEGKSNYEMLQQKTLGGFWHIKQEHKYGGVHHTLYHDTLKNYESGPRLLPLYYCFDVS